MRALTLTTIASEAIMSSFIILSVGIGEEYPLFSTSMAMVIILVPYVLDRKGLIHIPSPYVLWIFALNFLHVTGVRFHFYDTLWWWDILTHLVSITLIAMLVMEAFIVIGRTFQSRPPFLYNALFVIAASIVVGVIWEILEFLFDGIFSMHMQYSLADTVKDLAVDAIGGLIVALSTGTWLRTNSDEPISGFGIGERVQRLLREAIVG